MAMRACGSISQKVKSQNPLNDSPMQMLITAKLVRRFRWSMSVIVLLEIGKSAYFQNSFFTRVTSGMTPSPRCSMVTSHVTTNEKVSLGIVVPYCVTGTFIGFNILFPTLLILNHVITDIIWCS